MDSERKGGLPCLDRIDSRIVLIRGHRVILDVDLADIYGVPTKSLNQAIKRNLERFPSDFAFRLTPGEARIMRSQIVTASRRNIRYLPFVFTEHGAIMAANMLHSPRAVQMSVFVVRAFVRIRQALVAHKELAHKLSELERRVGGHDSVIRELVSAIRRLAEPPPSPPRRRIGFTPPGEEGP